MTRLKRGTASARSELDEQKSEQRDRAWGRWLQLANLVLTASVAVGVAFLQLRLVQVAEDAKTQSEFAHLELKSGELPGSVIVANSGPAIASNISIDFVLSSVPYPWTPVVDRISKLEVAYLPHTTDITITTTVIQSPSSPNVVSGENAVQAILRTLPRNTDMTFEVAIDPSVPVETYSIERPITLSVRNELSTTVPQLMDFWPSVERYFEGEFAIVELSVTSYCDNCEGVQKWTLTVPSLLSPASTLWRGSLQVGDRFQFEVPAHLTYIMPSAFPHTPVTWGQTLLIDYHPELSSWFVFEPYDPYGISFRIASDILDTPNPEHIVLAFYQTLGQANPAMDVRDYLSSRAAEAFNQGTLKYGSLLPTDQLKAAIVKDISHDANQDTDTVAHVAVWVVFHPKLGPPSNPMEISWRLVVVQNQWKMDWPGP